MAENFIPLKLPSKGKVYKDIDLASVSARVLKGKDEKIIAEMSFDNMDAKFVSVLRNVLKGIDPVALTLGDRKYVLLWLAINSYSKMFPIEFVCDFCLQKIPQYEVDLSLFDVVELPDDFSEPYRVGLTDGKEVFLRLMTVSDELEIVKFEKSGANSWLYRYALSIVDTEKDMAAKINWLEEMAASDLALIRAFHERYDHGPMMEAEYKCPKCGGSGVVAVPFRIEMVFPYGATLKKNFGAAV